ncbi:uncharacterized protein LOC134822217 [Bolinopsis microptera]|uniref:uncharacterized protein LOC134822217 n=1 Tax=Bolinopsis microptera TaxID=2820187 RepID=UPI00307A2F01
MSSQLSRMTSDQMALESSSMFNNMSLLYDSAYKESVAVGSFIPTSEPDITEPDTLFVHPPFDTSAGTGTANQPSLSSRASLPGFSKKGRETQFGTVVGLLTAPRKQDTAQSTNQNTGSTPRDTNLAAMSVPKSSGSSLGHLVGLVQQTQNITKVWDTGQTSDNNQAKLTARYEAKIKTLELKVKTMEEANKRESINSSTRWRQILSEKDAKFSSLRTQVRILKENKTRSGNSPLPVYPTIQPPPMQFDDNHGNRGNHYQFGGNSDTSSRSEIDYSDPFLCQMEISRLIRVNQELVLHLKVSEFDTTTFLLSHVILALIAVLLL